MDRIQIIAKLIEAPIVVLLFILIGKYTDDKLIVTFLANLLCLWSLEWITARIVKAIRVRHIRTVN
jgi:hypothetical protein